MNLPQVREHLGKSKYRILATHFFDADAKERQSESCASSFSDFNQLTVYDYTHNRSIFIKIKSWEKKLVEITESNFQPEPNDE